MEEEGLMPPNVEVFDLADDVGSSSEGGVTPEMDSHVLFIKLKEVRVSSLPLLESFTGYFSHWDLLVCRPSTKTLFLKLSWPNSRLRYVSVAFFRLTQRLSHFYGTVLIWLFPLQMILLENAESQKRHYEKKCEDMAHRMRDNEKTLQGAQKDISNYQVRLLLMSPSWPGIGTTFVFLIGFAGAVPRPVHDPREWDSLWVQPTGKEVSQS